MKKGASHPSSIQEPDADFRKLLDKVEQAEMTMKLEETENLKQEFVNNIQITTSQINHIHDSDTELSEQITGMCIPHGWIINNINYTVDGVHRQ